MRHVLVVDDDIAIRQTVSAILEDEGYSVREAEDGETAIAILRETTHPVVVLLDYMMPRMDGLDVLTIIDADSSLKGRLTVVFMTAGGKTLPPTLAHILSTDAYPLMRKPFEIDVLISTIDRAAQRLPDDDSLSPSTSP